MPRLSLSSRPRSQATAGSPNRIRCWSTCSTTTPVSSTSTRRAKTNLLGAFPARAVCSRMHWSTHRGGWRHFIFQKCLQHAWCPDRWMSPPSNVRRLSGWGSREGHCNRGAILLRFPWFGHRCIYLPTPLRSTALCWHGFVATMRALTSVRSHHPPCRCREFVPIPDATWFPEGQGHYSQRPPLLG